MEEIKFKLHATATSQDAVTKEYAECSGFHELFASPEMLDAALAEERRRLEAQEPRQTVHKLCAPWLADGEVYTAADKELDKPLAYKQDGKIKPSGIEGNGEDGFSLRIGWDSLASFSRGYDVDGTPVFAITKLVSLNRNFAPSEEEVPLIQSTLFKSICTRGVESCTAALISDPDMTHFIFMHLDAHDLDKVLTAIRARPQYLNGGALYVSHQSLPGAPSEAEFCNALKEVFCPKAVYDMDRMHRNVTLGDISIEQPAYGHACISLSAESMNLSGDYMGAEASTTKGFSFPFENK